MVLALETKMSSESLHGEVPGRNDRCRFCALLGSTDSCGKRSQAWSSTGVVHLSWLYTWDPRHLRLHNLLGPRKTPWATDGPILSMP